MDRVLQDQDVFELVRETVGRIITLCLPVRFQSLLRSPDRIAALIIRQRMDAVKQVKDSGCFLTQACLQEVSGSCQVIA